MFIPLAPLIAILVLIFIGPERLPKLMRQLGEYTAQVRGVIRSLNQEFAEELKPLHEIRGLADDLNPTRQLGNLLDPDVQRSAPKRREPAKANANPMSQISHSSSDGGSSQPALMPMTQEPFVNPMTQISQAMKKQATTAQPGEIADNSPPVDTTKEV